METKRYEPMVAATYPAAMAGLCLTSLAIISSKFCVSTGIVFLLSAASLAFITSSFFIFLHVVLVEWGESSNTQNQDKTFWWSISKWAFLIGIIFVFIAIILIFCNFCLTGFEIITHQNSSLPLHEPV
jgi:hypothetical protein